MYDNVNHEKPMIMHIDLNSAFAKGAYDPTLNLTYWGIGNPGPDWNPDQRPGDNLYSDCVVAQQR